MNHRSPLAAAVCIVGAAVAGCAGDTEPGPPAILYGADVCDQCRMVISEERHAAAARLEDGVAVRFDDPGCLRTFLGALDGGAASGAWVHDETAAWRAAGEAWFVEDPRQTTPMASGIMAFGSEPAAAEAARALGTAPKSWAGLTAVSERPAV